MRLHRFFSSEKILEKIGLGIQNKQSNLVFGDNNIIALKIATEQWRRVFRFGLGDRVILFDGSGKDYLCEIKEYGSGNTKNVKENVGGVILKIIEVRENEVKPIRDVSLYCAIVKKDMFEWIVEKATEIGVYDITPVLTERSEKKNLNIERLEKISIEAAEQSGRGTIPKIHPVVDCVPSISEISKKKQLAIAFDPSGVKFSEKDLKNIDKNVTVFIGPEGGWSTEELKNFERAGISIFSLGPQILRAETAVIAALSRLVF